MHLAYLDDSGTRDKKGKFQVMAGVIIEGWEFRDLELLMGVLVEQLIPEDRRENFEEFHAWQLFGGYEIFDGIDREERLKVVQELLSSVEDHKVTLVYGAVDTEKLANKIYSSADPLDMCFRLCVQGIESWAAQLIRMPVSTKSQAPQDAQPLVVLICDDFESRKKEIIKKILSATQKQSKTTDL